MYSSSRLSRRSVRRGAGLYEAYTVPSSSPLSSPPPSSTIFSPLSSPPPWVTRLPSWAQDSSFLSNNTASFVSGNTAGEVEHSDATECIDEHGSCEEYGSNEEQEWLDEVEHTQTDRDRSPSSVGGGGVDEQTSGPADPRRVRHHTQSQVLDKVVAILRHHRWTFEKFLEAWVGISTPSDLVVHHRSYRTAKLRRRHLQKTIDWCNENGICSLEPMTSHVTRRIRKELNDLTRLAPCFGLYSRGATADSLGETDFKQAQQQMQTLAPTWFEVLRCATRNQRASRGTYDPQLGRSLPSSVEEHETPSQKQLQKFFVLTSIVCSTRAKQKSNFLLSWMDIYLHGSGVKRRVIEVLAGFGLCHGYTQGNKLMVDLTSNAELLPTPADSYKLSPTPANYEQLRLPTDRMIQDRLKLLGPEPQLTVVYDNFNFLETRRDEITGHTAFMQNMTTAAAIRCPSIPSSGLTQSMHRPFENLDVHDIYFAPGIVGEGTDLSRQICQFMCFQAMRYVHPTPMDKIFEHDTPPQFPSIDRLPAEKTRYWQFGATYEDEGCLSGAYKVHESLFLEQLGLSRSGSGDDYSASQDEFVDRLWLVHGDQLTSSFMRTIKVEQGRAERPFDRRDWLLPLPAWFHIQMKALEISTRTHWGAVDRGSASQHCLSRDITVWNRSFKSKDQIKYHQSDPCYTNSFYTRVLGLFYQRMSARGFLPSVFWYGSFDEFESRVSRLTVRDVLDIFNDIYEVAFTHDAWTGKNYPSNTEFRSMCRLLQQLELFLTLRHAIKLGDIGHVRRLVDPLIVMFIGCGLFNYAREMLYYRWLLSDRVSDHELQVAILSSGFVNWRGQLDGFKPIDLGLEHNNCSIKLGIQAQKNSTHDTDKVFHQRCLTDDYVSTVRGLTQSVFGQPNSSKHTRASARHDVFSLVLLLGQNGAFDPSSPPSRNNTPFDSPDIRALGVAKLDEYVRTFNSQYVRGRRDGDAGIRGESDEADMFAGTEDVDFVGSIHEYALDCQQEDGEDE